jgi:hypothetical protein
VKLRIALAAGRACADGQLRASDRCARAANYLVTSASKEELRQVEKRKMRRMPGIAVFVPGRARKFVILGVPI